MALTTARPRPLPPLLREREGGLSRVGSAWSIWSPSRAGEQHRAARRGLGVSSPPASTGMPVGDGVHAYLLAGPAARAPNGWSRPQAPALIVHDTCGSRVVERDFLDELEGKIGLPKKSETEDEFVARAKRSMLQLLKNKLN